MKNIKSALILILSLFLLVPQTIEALNPARRDQVDLVWSGHSNHRGLYTRSTTAGGYINNGFTISVNAMYYYGDVELPKFVLRRGFLNENFSGGLSAMFAYTMPLSSHCNWRFGGGLGILRGNNHGSKYDEKEQEKYTRAERDFMSFFIEPSAGIEYYPFSNAGFFLYAGVALNLNFRIGGHNQFGDVKGSAASILPVIPLELGYDFRIGRSWLFRVFAGVHQGVCDLPYMNLDGYPTITKVNGEKVKVGTGKKNNFADGYFMVGVSLSYKWHNCEKCRQYKW